MEITVGKDLTAPYEMNDGQIVDKNLGEHIDQVLKDMIAKMLQPHHFLIKGLMPYSITSEDRRYQRNIDR